MKIKYIAPILLVGGLIAASGCADRSAKQREIEKRVAWEESLLDSLASTRAELDSTRKYASALRGKVASLLDRFRSVENPREVEKYYLPEVKGFSYPLTSTGLAARLTASEQMEIVAAHVGSPFNAIRIEAPGGISVETPTVAHDQALNYRSGGMTTVAFSGKEIDSLAYKLTGIESPVTVVYLENGKQMGRVSLPSPQIEALRLASELASTHRSALLAERRMQILTRKMQLLENR